MSAQFYVCWFNNLRLQDVASVGGKNASLGELYSELAAEGVRVPDGFALTAQAYRDALSAAGAWDQLRRLLGSFDHHDVALLAERAEAARRRGRKPSPPAGPRIRSRSTRSKRRARCWSAAERSAKRSPRGR